MQLSDGIATARDTEKNTRVVRRLAMIDAFLTTGSFSVAARDCGCDKRTVARWWRELGDTRKTPREIREALSDRPRSGRPPKIDKKLLAEAEKWCKGRAFETGDLSDKLEDLSGVKLGMCQVRRYARQWRH